MFDNGAVHIDNVERPIRSDRKVDRSKPVVRTGQELDIGSGATRAKRRAIWVQDPAVDQIAGRLAYEHVVRVLARQPVPAVDRDAARGRDLAGVVGVVRPVPGERKDDRVGSSWSHVMGQRRDFEQRHPVGITTLQDDLLGGIAVGTDKTISEIVIGQTELTATGDGIVVTGEGIEAKIAARDRNRFGRRTVRGRPSNNRPISQPVGDIDPMVGPQCRMVGA